MLMNRTPHFPLKQKNAEVDFFSFSDLGLTVTKINFEIIFPCGIILKILNISGMTKKIFEKTKFWFFYH